MRAWRVGQVYVWARRNDDVRMSFLGLFPFAAPYLPWVLLSFSVLLGNPAQTDLVGIAVGHIYCFLEYTVPTIAEARGWRCTRVLKTPRLLEVLCGGGLAAAAPVLGT